MLIKVSDLLTKYVPVIFVFVVVTLICWRVNSWLQKKYKVRI